ncbi:hypothetical protein BH11ACT2_BH11ACT2_06060 [soil metagenome]
MRLATVMTDEGTSAAFIEAGEARLLAYADAGAVLAAQARGESLIHRGEVGLDGLRFAPPVLRPEKIICVGLNYHAHAEEAGLAIPSHPLLFAKFSRAMIGAEDDIVIPVETEKCDWEAELALVIGGQVRRASAEDALGFVAGYTVVNDVSMRDWQKHTSQMLPGKTFESSTPIGPWLVAPGDVDHGRNLDLSCTVNGVVMQSSNTADMIFSAAEVISYVSHVITLMPGDVIALGTPSGIGSTRTPPLFLTPGDAVITEVEGIGALANACVADDGTRSSRYV